MKPEARVNILKDLETQGLETLGIDIYSLTDTELKQLNLKLSWVKQRKMHYAVRSDEGFLWAFYNGTLQIVSFSDTYKYGCRPLTFLEALTFEKLNKEVPRYRELWNR